MDNQGIEIKNVSKKYNNAGNEIAVLHDISLTIKPGDYIGLMGMNGAGKSTLIRMLNGLIKPGEGKIHINGMDTADSDNMTSIRKLVGVVFQNPDNQLICPVIEEEIAFGPENLGLPLSEINQRVNWALHAVEMEKMKHHSPHLLSGGQKQKIALASILAMLPSYLVLDEPFAMLDPVSRWELLAQIRRLNTEHNITIILSSHNPEDFMHAKRLIVLDHGSIYLQGSPREVYSQDGKLAAIGLEAPGIYQLIRQLQQAGCYFSDNPNSIQELVEIICQK
ncbi:MAG: energy-coupling factor transporter ATPase [Syntrophomonadaceae bacterium]|nr:energy-coupling factor transporter ATPase [Syntrophomonadaceae bacterium]